MSRVLTSGGQTAVTACRSLGHAPVHAALADVLERHVNPNASSMVRSPFIRWTVGQLRSLFLEAGFASVGASIDVGAMRCVVCPVEAFVVLATKEC
jgi:hypothetical protein